MTLGDMYISYEAAYEMAGLKTLNCRRSQRSLGYGLKAVKHKQNKHKSPLKNVESLHTIRGREKYRITCARTEAYKKSAVSFFQMMLNAHAEGGTRVAGSRGEEESSRGEGG